MSSQSMSPPSLPPPPPPSSSPSFDGLGFPAGLEPTQPKKESKSSKRQRQSGRRSKSKTSSRTSSKDKQNTSTQTQEVVAPPPVKKAKMTGSPDLVSPMQPDHHQNGRQGPARMYEKQISLAIQQFHLALSTAKYINAVPSEEEIASIFKRWTTIPKAVNIELAWDLRCCLDIIFFINQTRLSPPEFSLSDLIYRLKERCALIEEADMYIQSIQFLNKLKGL